MQYGPTEGMPALRRGVVGIDGRARRPLPPEQIVVTSGSQQGFELLVQAFVAPGTPVWVETPTYPAAVRALRLAGAAVRGIPSDQDGVCVQTLAAMLADCREEERPRLRLPGAHFCQPERPHAGAGTPPRAAGARRAASHRGGGGRSLRQPAFRRRAAAIARCRWPRRTPR
ncbi:aminotransferase class I/II-fold pyridoxal phosphate-dependent enzyme [Cupriavidus basilensis]